MSAGVLYGNQLRASPSYESTSSKDTTARPATFLSPFTVVVFGPTREAQLVRLTRMENPAMSQGASDNADARLGGLLKLLEITRVLATENDLDRILECVTNGSCKALSCERASLFLHDQETRELYTRVVTALEIEEIRAPIDRGITGWVARRRRVANIPHPQADARWNSSVDKQTGFTTRNIIAVPVISSSDDRLLGRTPAPEQKLGNV